jgi:hypothetical protein
MNLDIKPSCESCGLLANASAPYHNALTGETEYACKYIIDPYIAAQVAIVEQHVDVPSLRDSNGQIKLKGISGYFCSLSCLMQGLFTYGRCAGCSKKLPKKLLKNWHAVKDGEGVHQYGKFDYCSPECKAAYSARENIWSARHLLSTLTTFGIAVKLPETTVSESACRGRCANKHCGQGRDDRGNRVRARVPERGDYCSTRCKTLDARTKKDLLKARAGAAGEQLPPPSLQNASFSAHI